MSSSRSCAKKESLHRILARGWKFPYFRASAFASYNATSLIDKCDIAALLYPINITTSCLR